MPQPPFSVPFGRQLRSSGTSRGTLLSAAVHVALLLGLFWAGRRTFENANNAPGSGRGRGGGGGGGGNRTIAVWTVPAAARTQPAPEPVPPPLTVPQQTPATIPGPLPELPAVSQPQPLPQPQTGPGEGAGTGPGAGPGRGTGQGGGEGSGVGPGVGPDSGEGGGGRVYPPQLQGMILAPPGRPRELRGVEVTVTFRISERGDVVDVSVTPTIRDRGYRNEFLDRMRRYTFTPAMTREGRPVAAEYQIRFTIS